MKKWLKPTLLTIGFLFIGIAILLILRLASPPKSISLGYQPIIGPMLAVIADKKLEKATGHKIKWTKFSSGANSIKALALGEVVISIAGSSPAAAGISSNPNIELIYILDDIGSAEALVVRNGSNITNPQDLIGKKIGVPFLSTTHFHLLFALEQFGINQNKVEILNLQPLEIVDAWAKEDIDAAFVWDPILEKITKNGRILITSGTLSHWGKPTFDGILVNKNWASKNKDFIKKFIQILNKENISYLNNPKGWINKNIAKISKISGSNKFDIPVILNKLNFLTIEQQLSSNWLGGGSANALKFTSEFLLKEKRIVRILSDYNQAVNSSYAKAAK